MTCAKHNLRMVRLVLHGRIHSAEHAALLAEIRRCPRCKTQHPAPPAPRHKAPAPPVPRAREEQRTREDEPSHPRR